MTASEMKAFTDCLDQDETECHKMLAAGGPAKETVSSATGKALAGGATLKAIIAAIMAALASGGGIQAIIAAILALIAPKP